MLSDVPNKPQPTAGYITVDFYEHLKLLADCLRLLIDIGCPTNIGCIPDTPVIVGGEDAE
jgi:hypothetical protein